MAGNSNLVLNDIICIIKLKKQYLNIHELIDFFFLSKQLCQVMEFHTSWYKCIILYLLSVASHFLPQSLALKPRLPNYQRAKKAGQSTNVIDVGSSIDITELQGW